MPSSWAAIASKKLPKQTKCLQINYNIERDSNKVNKRDDDGIPRHKELTPDPADDYTMTNGTELESTLVPSNWDGGWLDYRYNRDLKAHKQSLPLSIQRVIEWSNQIIGYQRVINLDFDEIEKDLKYQYKKHKGDKQKLKEIYFNYNPSHKNDWNYWYRESSDYDPTNFMYFGQGISTMIHFIFKQISDRHLAKKYITNKSQRSKRTKQAITLLKLLIKNNIIDIDDTLYASTFGVTVWECIRRKAASSADDEMEHNIDNLVDLITVCLHQKDIEEQSAILRVFIRKTQRDDNDGHIEMNISCENISDITYWERANHQMNNTQQVIEKLLFRGMLPFQFVDVLTKVTINPSNSRRVWNTETTLFQPIDNDKESKKYMNDLFNEYKIKQRKVDIVENNEEPFTQMALLSPLNVLPHLYRARMTMNEILSECIYINYYMESGGVCKEIANMISYYLFVRYDIFYPQHVQNNLNVKAIGFLNQLTHFAVDEQFQDEFNQKYNDKQVVNYMVDNYLYTLSKLLGKSRTNNFKVICAIIETYNDGNDEDHKFPLQPHGAYFILESMLTNATFAGQHQIFQDLLKFYKKVYKDEFDINHKLELEHIHQAVTDQTFVTYLIQNFLYPSGMDIATTVIKFILSEFKEEYNIKDPCLLYICMKYKNINVFKHLIANYDYSLDKICSTMMTMIKDIMETDSGTRDWSHQWNQWNKPQSKRFLKDLKESCLRSKCEDEKDIQFLNKNIKDAWKIFIDNVRH